MKAAKFDGESGVRNAQGRGNVFVSMRHESMYFLFDCYFIKNLL